MFELLTNLLLDVANLELLTAVHDADARTLLAGSTGTARAVGVVLDIVWQSVVNDVRQVIDVQSAGSHVGSHQQLYGMLAELLHGQVALLLREVAMQRLGIVPILDELVGHLLRLYLRAAEDDGEDAGIVVHQSLQCQVLVLGIHHVVDVVHMLGTLVAAAYYDFLVVMQVSLGNALDVAAHGGREEQRVTVVGHTIQYGVDALLESHVQHLVGLVQHHVLHVVQLCHAALHQVDQSARRSHDDLHAFAQGTNLLFYRCTAIDRLDVDAVQVFGKVAHVVGNLQAQLTRRRQHESQWNAAAYLAQLRTWFLCNALQYGNAERRRLARARLGQCYHVVLVS